MGKSQSSQLKALESLHSREANDVMKRLEQESKVEEQEKGSMASVSREELQRERRARLVKRGVTERNKLQVNTSQLFSVFYPSFPPGAVHRAAGGAGGGPGQGQGGAEGGEGGEGAGGEGPVQGGRGGPGGGPLLRPATQLLSDHLLPTYTDANSPRTNKLY